MADGLFEKITSKHPELSEVEVEFVKSLCKILSYLESAEVNREYLRYLGEARLLAGSMGLIKKGSFVEASDDLGAMLQDLGGDS